MKVRVINSLVVLGKVVVKKCFAKARCQRGESGFLFLLNLFFNLQDLLFCFLDKVFVFSD